MKTVYIECNMGCAGDMLAGALLEICPDRNGYFEMMKALRPYGVMAEAKTVQKCGITGTHIDICVDGIHEGEHHHGHENHHHSHHHGMSYQAVLEAIEKLPIEDQVKQDAKTVYRFIGEAEGKVHGKEISQIHFHEVGTMDALADVVGCCWLMKAVGAQQVLASPVNTGSGSVTCAHGVLPVPAPATERLLRTIASYSDGVESELCTPTGAALLKYFVKDFCARPVMAVEKTGYGMGTKDFERVNCVRAFLGETKPEPEHICELVCNLDDMTGEALSYACAALYECGALEVYTTPVFMKKGRNGTELCCLCKDGEQDRMAGCMLKHTTTRGVRIRRCERRTLDYRFETRKTPFGDIRIKISDGYGVHREKPEFEDVRKAAEKSGASIEEILREVR